MVPVGGVRATAGVVVQRAQATGRVGVTINIVKECCNAIGGVFAAGGIESERNLASGRV